MIEIPEIGERNHDYKSKKKKIIVVKKKKKKVTIKIIKGWKNQLVTSIAMLTWERMPRYYNNEDPASSPMLVPRKQVICKEYQVLSSQEDYDFIVDFASVCVIRIEWSVGCFVPDHHSSESKC